MDERMNGTMQMQKRQDGNCEDSSNRGHVYLSRPRGGNCEDSSSFFSKEKGSLAWNQAKKGSSKAGIPEAKKATRMLWCGTHLICHMAAACLLAAGLPSHPLAAAT